MLNSGRMKGPVFEIFVFPLEPVFPPLLSAQQDFKVLARDQNPTIHQLKNHPRVLVEETLACAERIADEKV